MGQAQKATFFFKFGTFHEGPQAEEGSVLQLFSIKSIEKDYPFIQTEMIMFFASRLSFLVLRARTKAQL